MTVETIATANALVAQDDLVREILTGKIEDGVLIPLKTVQEIRDDHRTAPALLTRAPTKNASVIINYLREQLPEDVVKGMPHLRRCAKPSDLPAHLKTQFMNGSAQSRQIHTGKSAWVYILLGLEKDLDLDKIMEFISSLEDMEEEVFCATIPVPLMPPTSQIQAMLWCNQFWPTVYRKNNPLGPHPSSVSRSTEDIAPDAPLWLALAHQLANEGSKAGVGEPVGACIVHRPDEGPPRLVAVATDGRWANHSIGEGVGNPMAHAVMRVISLVAQKLVRHEQREESRNVIMEHEAFQDDPLLDIERQVFEQDHPNPDGYLCHGLELYVTHEPCVMCSMGVLHSRMGKVIYSQRMPLTGGMSAEDRNLEEDSDPEANEQGGGRGLGLFWRRELNWSMLAWEWQYTEISNPLNIDPTTHA